MKVNLKTKEQKIHQKTVNFDSTGDDNEEIFQTSEEIIDNIEDDKRNDNIGAFL